jgi:hypothetical protein
VIEVVVLVVVVVAVVAESNDLITAMDWKSCRSYCQTQGSH